MSLKLTSYFFVNALEENFLNYYDTPEPFFEYHHQTGELMTVLVIENKDTWFTFRKLMQATGKNSISGTEIYVLLYGEGNKITKQGALEEYRAAMLGGQGGQGGQAARFLYFGDLDWEGIRLFFRTREANPSLDIKPFVSLYRLMLELAQSVELPKSLDQRGVTGPLHEFLSLLGLTEESGLNSILAEGRYIPQEIVNYQVAAKILK
ncbi:MAG: DUF2220 family protein [Desulfosporosinus sp.]|nr:DUF2220 family protein [Desulfosporosinus sp.]